MKQVIRLTESDLHKIVKESVQKILNEADPRSWASVADRYAETDPEKAAYARKRAAQQWNKQYGHLGNVRSGQRFIGRTSREMFPSYDVQSTSTEYGPNGAYDAENKATYYTPKNNNMTDYKWSGYRDPDELDRVEGSERQYKGNPTNPNFQGYNVARQMAQGNGVYDKKRGGWQ